MAEFGEQLTSARKAAGMTQEDLASAIHVSRTTISSWERGRTQPDLDTLRQLSTALHWDFMASTTGMGEETTFSAGNGSVAPSEVKKSDKKWLIAGVCGAVIILAVCFLLFVLPVLQQPENPNLPPAAALNAADLLPEEPEILTIEWFRGGNIRGKNEPWLDIQTKVLVNTDSQTEPFWRYILTFEEIAGSTFHFDQLKWFCFWTADRYVQKSFSSASGAVWEDDKGRNWEFIGGDPVQDMEGYGFIIYGHDDAGTKMSFRTFIDMTKAPRE